MKAIRIELKPDEEAQLREFAAQRGEQLENLAGDLLRTLLPGANAPRTLPQVLDESGVFHEDRWEQVLASIQADSASTPALPLEAVSRAAFYNDHD